MASHQSNSPFKDLFDIWERNAAHYWDEVLRNPLFLETLGRNLELSLTFQRAWLKTLEAGQTTWGLPTRAEQELARHHLNQLTTHVQHLSRRIEEMEGQT